MRSTLNPKAVTTAQLDCPGCGGPMEIIDRFTLYGVPAPVEHVKVRCVVGHWFTIPTEWLSRADGDASGADQAAASNTERPAVIPVT